MSQKHAIAKIPLNKHTVIKVFLFLRQICVDHRNNKPIKLGGGRVKVEIDKSLFRHKQKYHRGRQPERELWVFGLAENTGNKKNVSLHLVDDRKADTLLPSIEQVCPPENVFHSDKYASYRQISSRLHFEHKVVNHSENFVDPITKAHTQCIETRWNCIKVFIKSRKSTVGTNLDSVLAEFQWKNNIGYKNGLGSLLELLLDH